MQKTQGEKHGSIHQAYFQRDNGVLLHTKTQQQIYGQKLSQNKKGKVSCKENASFFNSFSCKLQINQIKTIMSQLKMKREKTRENPNQGSRVQPS